MTTGSLKADKLPGYYVQRAARLMARVGEARLRPLGIGVACLPVFGTLKDGSRLSQAEIVKRVRIEQPTMAQLLKRMEKAGLIEREPDPSDGRSSLISLSEKAHGLMPSGRDVLRQLNAEATAGLSDAETHELCRLLAKVIDNLEPIVDGEDADR